MIKIKNTLAPHSFNNFQKVECHDFVNVFYSVWQKSTLKSARNIAQITFRQSSLKWNYPITNPRRYSKINQLKW